MIDRKLFFDSVRATLFKGSLSAGQVDGMTRILDEWNRSQIPDLRFLAYMLATTFHETAFTMQPIREMGDEAYLRSKLYYPWVGEGLVQVTWKENAAKFGATAPGQLMAWPLCLKPLFDGMLKGMFAKHKETGLPIRLADYFNATTDDPVNARRIINGTDKANTIAHYHGLFLNAIKASLVSDTSTVTVIFGGGGNGAQSTSAGSGGKPQTTSNDLPGYKGPVSAPSANPAPIPATPPKSLPNAPMGPLAALLKLLILLFTRKAPSK